MLKNMRDMKGVFFCSMIFIVILCVVTNLTLQSGKIFMLRHFSFWNFSRVDEYIPIVYGITPTYSRLVQKAELTRLCYTFEDVKNFHWIIVEDSDHKTKLVETLLKGCNVRSTHLNIATPLRHKITYPRASKGVAQRNLAIRWLREMMNFSSGVVYFMDDDNTYDRRLFDQMRYTKGLSMWPVAFAGTLRHSGPIVENGTIKDFRVAFLRNRRFPGDMAGFAVSLDLLRRRPNAKFSPAIKDGTVESDFMSLLNISVKDVEPLANDCKEVLVWHTHTQQPYTGGEESWTKTHDKKGLTILEV